MDVDPVELAHWKAVAAKPFDEAPRWEYLKWLKTRTDKSHQERAKFMALQMEAAFSKPWDSLALEAANFRSAYFAAWGPILPSEEREPRDARDWTPSYQVLQWREGFVERVQIWNLYQARNRLAEWLGDTPLTALDFRESFEQRSTPIIDIVRSPPFNRLRSLRVKPLGDACDELLTACDLTNLRELVIEGTRADTILPSSGDDAVRTLLKRPVAKQLRSLGLLLVGELREHALDSVDSLANLERLAVNDAIRGNQLSYLLEGLPNLRRLEIHGRNWGKTVGAWSRLPRLEELVVVNAPAQDLRETLGTNKLEGLVSLRIERVRDATAEDFAFAFRSLNRLQRLSIRRSSLGDEGLAAFLRSHAFPHLTALELQFARVTDAGLFEMPKSIHLPKLRWVRVDPIGDGVSSQCIYALNQRWEIANELAFE